MKEYFVKEVSQSELQVELNAFAEQGWAVFKLHANETSEFSTYWTIIVERDKP